MRAQSKRFRVRGRRVEARRVHLARYADVPRHLQDRERRAEVLRADRGLESRYRFGYACRIEVTSVVELTDEEFTRQRDADTNEVFRQLWATRRAKEIEME